MDFICYCALYLGFGYGAQAVDRDLYLSGMASNYYGRMVGEASITLEFENGLYLEAKHISGVNTIEYDHGLNAIMIGARINLFESK